MLKNIAIKNLEELYDVMGILSSSFESSSGFTIHHLQDTFINLPVTSVAFRPNYFSFLFINNAFGNYTIDDQKFNVTSQTVYFTNPGNHRVFHWEEITDVYLVTFDEAYLKKYVHADIYDHFSFLLTETVAPRKLSQAEFKGINKICDLIQEEYLNETVFKHQVIGSLMVVLLLKIKEYFFQNYNPIYEGNRSSQIVKNFKLHLEQHFRDLSSGNTAVQMRVQDYAEKQALHVNYISSVIKNKTGRSINAWIIEKTITEAKVLLQNSDFSIKEIGIRLGFLEAPHFSNYFKKHTSTSPVTYRKQYFNI